jgi:uncharacterized SAM-binding protein YcdF (DUF218 family)
MKLALTKEHTGRKPTWLGRLLIAILTIAILFGITANLYSFLAPNKPPHEGLFVVEGWIHDFALDEAVRIYRAGNYSKIICTGVPIETGSYIQQFKSYPEMTTARLLELGIDKFEIITSVSEETKKDRTYVAATAMRSHLIAHNIVETNIHLVTTGPHGRRSRLLFQKALGKNYNIGVTCLDDSGYEPDRWYAYSQGVRSVIGELIAYVYAKFLFYP